MPDSFAARLIRWQQHAGRHGLPWQGSHNAYHVWLSEIMLQQTQVQTVLAYYTRFLARFPTVIDLAAAPLDDVLAHWSGLGYYARARNLHKAAQIVATEYAGVFPRDPAQLLTLPGIGRSTAAAIAAFAFGARATILDGNVKRLLLRHLALDADPSAKATETQLWLAAEARLPLAPTHPDMIAYTQGLMDLGNLICTRSKPRCEACPVHTDCQAHLTGRTDELPRPKARKALPTKQCVLLIAQHAGKIALQQRPPSGIWGGLFCLPEYADTPNLPAGLTHTQAWPTFTHVFTHFRLDIHPIQANATAPHPAEWQWFTPETALTMGLPQPTRRLLESLLKTVPPHHADIR